MNIRKTPLSNAENKWLRDVEKLLSNPPSERLGLYTTGDNALCVFDNRFLNEIHSILDSENKDFPQAVFQLDIDLGDIKSKQQIHSVSG
jgi:hypothetical protein